MLQAHTGTVMIFCVFVKKSSNFSACTNAPPKKQGMHKCTAKKQGMHWYAQIHPSAVPAWPPAPWCYFSEGKHHFWRFHFFDFWNQKIEKSFCPPAQWFKSASTEEKIQKKNGDSKMGEMQIYCPKVDFIALDTHTHPIYHITGLRSVVGRSIYRFFDR